MEGNRKFLFSIAVVVALAAVTITVVIVQPPGVSLEALLGGDGVIAMVVGAMFKLSNLQEHKIKAGGDKP